MTRKTALSVSQLYKVFGRRPEETVRRIQAGASRQEVSHLGTAAVIDANFEVKDGEIFVVMGLSGSGKSTLIRTLNGLWTPTHGAVEVAGQNIAQLSKKQVREIRQQHMSMVFQHFALFPHRTVLENAAYGLEIQGIDRNTRNEKATELLDLVGLKDWYHAYPSELSGGMQQRVGIARALAAETDILLMDEAFSALDPLIRHEMQELLLDLQQRLQKTVVFITHDLNEAMFLGDRIAVMRDGRIVQIGTPEDILTDPANDYVAQFVQDVDRARVLTAGSTMEPAKAVVQATGGPRAALRIMRDLQTSAAYVVDRNKRLVGVVYDRDIVKLVRQGITDLTSAIRDDHTSVDAETTLSDLYEPAIETPLPLAITDSAGRLLGVVPRITLLAALGNISNGNGNDTPVEPPLMVPEAEITKMLEAN